MNVIVAADAVFEMSDLPYHVMAAVPCCPDRCGGAVILRSEALG
jgi:dissimilatory sulfite reductase (desulfoviridin) alpha/beta subunit